MINNPSNPTSDAHLFVYKYTKEKADLAHNKGEPYTWEDSQNTLREAWKIAKDKGLSTKAQANPKEDNSMFTINNPFAHKSDDMFKIRQREMKVEQAEDNYDYALQKYGLDDGRTYKAYENMINAQRAYGRLAYQNPKMPVGYYRDLPANEPVIVREYARKLPRRKGVPSMETPYKRLKRTDAKIVGGEHSTLGQRALTFEIAHGGGPIIDRRVANRPASSNRPASPTKQRQNPASMIRVAILSALALAGIMFITKGADVNLNLGNK